MAEEEASRLTDERVSLVVELWARKDELFAFRTEVTKEKKALEAEYDVGFEAIFNYGYGCCAFAHKFVKVSLRFQTGCRARQSH